MRKTSHLRKAEIVATILALADQIGPDRVTTGAVANEVGVTQAALFRHFPTKAAMWSELPVDRIRALIRAQLDQIAATPAMPMLLFSRELNVENAALRTAFHGRLTAFHGHLLREVELGQQSHTLRDDVAAADVAVLLTSLVQGVAIRWSLGARDFGLQAEGLRLLDVQLHLLGVEGG
jgi:TetR/AcrR family transcriptional regulator